MQPYQMASEEIRKQGESPSRMGSFAAGAGVGLAAGKILPLLNSFIPESTAIKGLGKIDPRFGSFIKTAMNGGASFDQVKEFISDKIKKDESNKSKDRNIIEQYSPELFAFLKEQIGQGRSPIEAGAMAQMPKSKHLSAIKKLEQDHKAPWSSIIETVFGTAQQPQQQQAPNMQQQQSTQTQAQQMPNMGQQQQQSPQQGGMGQGQQALMQMIQQINQKLGQK